VDAPSHWRNMRGPPTQARLDLELPRHAAASSMARRELTRCFAPRLDDALVTDMTIVANELVANALTHGTGAISMRVRATGQRVSMQVSDEGDGFTAPGDPEPHKGLAIVDTLADSWGVRAGSTHVWCRFALPRP
jgi:anti-sigma regulatory factor (Ser/Thr protein kinase)